LILSSLFSRSTAMADKKKGDDEKSDTISSGDVSGLKFRSIAYGTTFTYYIEESPKTLKQERRKREKDLVKEKQPIPIPALEELRAKENEVTPHLIFTITDEDGNLIRKLAGSVSTGLNRTTWNLRYPGKRPVNLRDGKYNPTSMGGSGMFLLPGTYYVAISQYHRDEILWKFNGQRPKASREENRPAPPSINERLRSIVWIHYRSTGGITQTQRDQFDILKEEFPPVLEALKVIYETSLPEIERELEEIGAPYTPGRIPVWTLD